MLSLFKDLKDAIKASKANVDGFVFKLHYKFTALVLTVFAICISSVQYIGDPIDCMSSTIKSDKEAKMLDTYCWIHSTFTLPSALNKTVGVDVAFPGVDKVTSKNQHEVTYHEYYQWVGFVLLIQAMLFYVPHYIWMAVERHRVRNMMLQLNMPVVEEKLDVKIDLVGKYFAESLKMHPFYAVGYLLCEMMNFANVVGQIFLVDTFLDNEFSKYGAEVFQFINMEQENRVDPMVRVFPKMTKCTFFLFGTSGDVQKYDALCILPLNVLNEKIYVFCWFWFVILAILSGLTILYRTPVMFLRPLRKQLIKRRNRYANPQVLDDFTQKAGMGDWWLLYLLSKNIDAIHFSHIVEKIDESIEGVRSRSPSDNIHDSATLPLTKR